MRKNIFVIGDLVVDHDVFVRELEPTTESAEGERRYQVLRRQDTVGGAGNSARILAVLNEGATFLWGVVGRSHWGTFRRILSNSHAIDGASSFVELRGIQDETDPPMDTVTRLLVTKDGKPNYLQRSVRFYDIGHLHVTDTKRRSVLYHLARVHKEKNYLDAIIINDFDKKALNRKVITLIGAFARRHRIPLFVDPRNERSKYEDIRGTAILPNLSEWCHLVDDENGMSRWRANLHEHNTLIDMAKRSFRYLPNFEYHIIKCDKDGAVLIFPHPSKKHLYAIYHAKPSPTRGHSESDQVGCGDILTAVFAAEFDKDNPSTDSALVAFHKANAAVACYREMSWHRMPSADAVEEKLKQVPLSRPRSNAEVSKGVLFLPNERNRHLSLSACRTTIPGLYSQDKGYQGVIKKLVDDIIGSWGPASLSSIIVGAPPGTGKTSILKALKQFYASQSMIHVVDESRQLKQLIRKNLDDYFADQLRSMPLDAKRLLVVVDEARKDPNEVRLWERGVNLLNAAHERNVRFLFVDAGFTRETERDPRWREVFGRCHAYFLPSLEERPSDITLIVAATLLESGKQHDIQAVRVEAGLLLSLIERTLEQPDPRELCKLVDQAYAAAIKTHHKGESTITISHRHLDTLPRREGASDVVGGYFEFVR